MDSATTLGAFLRAQRERLSPADVGLLSERRRRRTPGVRREDVAARAGVSVDYYARLEQGRGRNPTPGVLDALARALLLTDPERRYLHRLAHRGAPAATPVVEIDERTRLLLDTLDHVPAYVVDAYQDVLAWNPLGDAMLGLSKRPPEQRNLLWLLYVDATATAVTRPQDADAVGASMVESLRARSASDPDDPRLQALIERLAAASPRFAAVWAEHRVGDQGRGSKHVAHPLLGDIRLDYVTLDLPEPGQRLLLYLAAPGSPARRAFELLAVVGHQGFAPGERVARVSRASTED